MLLRLFGKQGLGTRDKKLRVRNLAISIQHSAISDQHCHCQLSILNLILTTYNHRPVIFFF